VGETEFGRGPGKTAEKSATLVSRSSEGSSRVGQPGAIVRRRAMPSGIPAGTAGEPAALGSEPLKLPQETQSMFSQQTAPPLGSSWPGGAIGASARKPNCDSASGVASTSVLWLASRATSAGKVSVPVTAPAAP
jgi:hypothetical protein